MSFSSIVSLICSIQNLFILQFPFCTNVLLISRISICLACIAVCFERVHSLISTFELCKDRVHGCAGLTKLVWYYWTLLNTFLKLLKGRNICILSYVLNNDWQIKFVFAKICFYLIFLPTNHVWASVRSWSLMRQWVKLFGVTKIQSNHPIKMIK